MGNRKKYILGNWKMNKDWRELTQFFSVFNRSLLADEKLANCRSIVYGVAPSYLCLQPASILAKGNTIIMAQDISAYDHGSYTGQVSFSQLKDVKVKHAIIGHSEARKYLGCDDKTINAKAITCLANSITPIICIGESLVQYNKKQTKRVLTNQLKTIFRGIKANDALKCIIAYEPLWAIGTGKTPTLEEISSLCGYIRSVFKSLYNSSVSNQMPILYGGSVNDSNALSIVTLKDVDGALIGGASLEASKFIKIIKDVKQWKLK